MDNSADAANALNVARQYLASKDYKGAERLCLKANRIHTTAEGTALLAQIKAAASGSPSTSSAPKASTSSAEPSASASGLKNRKATAAPEPQKREYTADQLAHVKRIRSCKATAYYEILNIQDKSCSDTDIKKAYRKHSLLLHPDKNGAPGSDEAFKLVSTAFQVLSDSDKRAHYDRYGKSPDDRSMPSGGGSPSFRRQGGFAGGGGMGDEMSPEDLFNMFFGGGGGFQGGFGGPGVRVHTFGGQPRRRAAPQAGQGQQGNTSTWVQLLPLLLLFAFSFLTQLPSLLNPPAPDPSYTFDPYPASTGKYQIARSTQTHHIDYYLDEQQLRSTKVWSDLLKQNPTLAETVASVGSVQLATLPNWQLQDSTKLKIPRSLLTFEANLEQAYVNLLQHRCENEQDYMARRRQQAMGFFGIGADGDKLEALKKETLPNCDRLRQLGVGQRSRYR